MDLNKSREFFDPNSFKQMIHIIGCGAIGSTVAENLTRLGIERITLWDKDTVDSHNIANQLFRFKDIGKPKTDALAEILQDINPDLELTLRDTFYKSQRLSGYVFLCVDNIETRKQIVKFNWNNPYIVAMFDFRMRLTDAQHYATPWHNKTEKENFINSMQFSHEEATAETPMSACGTTLSVAPTVRVISAYGVSNFINMTLGKPLKRLILSETFTHQVDAFEIK